MNKTSLLLTLLLPANLLDVVLPAQSHLTLSTVKQNTKKQIMDCPCANKKVSNGAKKNPN
jgi:hypothetical protein